MGAGKTTAARALAQRRGGEALDTDELVEARLGHSIAEEFERAGEAAFRTLEEEVVCETLARANACDVIALGGGSTLSARVREALKSHVVVLLDVDAQAAWERSGGAARPLAREWGAFEQLYEQRAPHYRALATAIVGAGARSDPWWPALEELAAIAPAAQMLWAHSASGSYPVAIGDGLVALDPWPRGRRFVISDANVAPLWAGRVGDGVEPIVIEAGEEHKTLAAAQGVWERLAQRGATRSDRVVAVGGGVVGDLAGFCASAYQRGIGVVQVPTTVVAQVDSAYGGKTGVDLPLAKNYVGAYHQPSAVLVDPQTLETLPAPERAAGQAEVIKTALIAGGDLWRRVGADEPLDQAMIRDCVLTKLGVVAQDERDGGRRQVLNLGHTVGHAIETAGGYGRHRHGEAVGLGLLAALRLSDRPELRETVLALLEAHGLPVRLEGVSTDDVLVALQRDKKRTTGSVPFVLVDAPGRVSEGHEVEPAALEAAVRELQA